VQVASNHIQLRRSHHDPQADELWMVCFYTELRGRAPNGILEQIDPLGINAHGDPDKGASMMPMLPTW